MVSISGVKGELAGVVEQLVLQNHVQLRNVFQVPGLATGTAFNLGAHKVKA